MRKRKEIHSVGAVVFRWEGKHPMFLILRSSQGHWVFPRGERAPRDENLAATATREILEETGITIDSFVPGFETSDEFTIQNGARKKVTLFLAEARTARVELSYEHTDYAWLPYEKARERFSYQGQKRMLDEARDFLSK